MAIGPFEIPPRARGSTSLRSRETAQKFISDEVKVPRPWGKGHKKMLCPNGTNTAPKTLKCHEALKMFQSGIFSVLASWDRDDGYSKNMLKDLMGQLTVIARELTSHIVDPKVRKVCGRYL